MTMNKTKITNLVDETIGTISGRELISVSEMTDLLLDIRLYLLLAEEATPTHEN